MQLNPDGSVAIKFDGATVRVKAPNVGQYRKIRELVQQSDEKRRGLVDEWRTEMNIPDPWPGDAATAEQVVALNTVTRRSNEFNENALLDIWHLILIGEAGGDKPFPSLALDSLPTVQTDEWPIELLTGPAYNQAMAHWAASPLASGVSPAAATNTP